MSQFEKAVKLLGDQFLRAVGKDIYQGKHCNYGKTWNVITAIVNLRYFSTSCQTM